MDSNNSEDKVWYPNLDGEEPSTIIFPYKSRSAGSTGEFSLSEIVRQHTNSRVATLNKQPIVEIESKQLYDVLGLLRALQYDVREYNASLASKSPNNESRYQSFRLQKVGVAFGVRFTSGERAEVQGLDDLIAHLEKAFIEAITQARNNLEQNMVDFDSLQE
jgi:hypothetical protein